MINQRAAVTARKTVTGSESLLRRHWRTWRPVRCSDFYFHKPKNTKKNALNSECEESFYFYSNVGFPHSENRRVTCARYSPARCLWVHVFAVQKLFWRTFSCDYSDGFSLNLHSGNRYPVYCWKCPVNVTTIGFHLFPITVTGKRWDYYSYVDCLLAGQRLTSN